MKRVNAWTTYNKKQLTELEKVCSGYMDFLDNGKTERECVKVIESLAKEHGYVDLKDVIKDKKKLKSGDKVYAICMNKTVAMFNLGKKKLENGLNILGAHIDSPRMDVKQNPLYENGDFAYFDTHYYGGIKKYQWVTLPLAIHGVVVKKDGSTLDISIGEDKRDPVFCVTDLLIHRRENSLRRRQTRSLRVKSLIYSLEAFHSRIKIRMQ